MEVVLTIMVVAGIAGAIVASNKRRSAFGWFLLCFLIPLCLIIILVLQPLKEESPKSGSVRSRSYQDLEKERSAQQALPDAHAESERGSPPIDSDDDTRWTTLVKYDPDIQSALKELLQFGEPAAGELKKAYLTVNDPSKLKHIVETIKKDFANPEERIRKSKLLQIEEAREDKEKLKEYLNSIGLRIVKGKNKTYSWIVIFDNATNQQLRTVYKEEDFLSFSKITSRR